MRYCTVNNGYIARVQRVGIETIVGLKLVLCLSSQYIFCLMRSEWKLTHKKCRSQDRGARDT